MRWSLKSWWVTILSATVVALRKQTTFGNKNWNWTWWSSLAMFIFTTFNSLTRDFFFVLCLFYFILFLFLGFILEWLLLRKYLKFAFNFFSSNLFSIDKGGGGNVMTGIGSSLYLDSDIYRLITQENFTSSWKKPDYMRSGPFRGGAKGGNLPRASRSRGAPKMKKGEIN